MIELTRVGSLALLTLAHGRANAFDVELLEGVRAALAESRRSDARALVVTGRGTIFSAGVDLLRVARGDRSYLERFLPLLSDALAELFLFPRPVVAAVNGHAIAGGAIAACACDYRILARSTARIGVPELRVGVPFPLVPAEITRYALGDRRAQRAMLMGGVVEGERAIEEGFVDELADADHLLERAFEVARSLAETPAASYERTKMTLRHPVRERWSRDRPSDDAEILEAWDSPEVRSALREYAERTLKKS